MFAVVGAAGQVAIDVDVGRVEHVAHAGHRADRRRAFVDRVVGDVRVRVDDAGRDELAGAVEDLGARRESARCVPTAAILPSRMTTVPLSIVPRVAVMMVALRIATTPGAAPWAESGRRQLGPGADQHAERSRRAQDSLTANGQSQKPPGKRAQAAGVQWQL